MRWEDDRPTGYDDPDWHRVLDDGTVLDEPSKATSEDVASSAGE